MYDTLQGCYHGAYCQNPWLLWVARWHDLDLTALLKLFHSLSGSWYHDHKHRNEHPHNCIFPRSVAKWKLVKLEHVRCIKEARSQKVTEEGECSVDHPDNCLCQAHGLAERLSVLAECEDRNQDLA